MPELIKLLQEAVSRDLFQFLKLQNKLSQNSNAQNRHILCSRFHRVRNSADIIGRDYLCSRMSEVCWVTQSWKQKLCYKSSAKHISWGCCLKISSYGTPCSLGFLNRDLGHRRVSITVWESQKRRARLKLYHKTQSITLLYSLLVRAVTCLLIRRERKRTQPLDRMQQGSRRALD